MTLVNWGLVITLLGTISIIILSLRLNPVDALRERNGGIEVNPKWFERLNQRTRKCYMLGYMVSIAALGMGTLVQIVGNL